MIRTCLSLVGAAAVAACGPGDPNPPTRPAAPVDTPEATAPATGRGPVVPGTGPTSFVGRWAADVSWCPRSTGPQRPIEITTTRFEGYENSCAIASVDQITGGYEAALSCTSEGLTTSERVRMEVSGQNMRLTWPERDGAVVQLTRCTTLSDTAPVS